MRQIEILDPVLDEIESDLGQQPAQPGSQGQLGMRPGSIIWNDQSTRLSLEYCRIAAKDLTSLIDNLTEHINSPRRTKRGASKIKVVLKKETLAKYEARLVFPPIIEPKSNTNP